MSRFSSEEESATTGILIVRKSARRCCRTSSPPNLGSFKSNRTKWGVTVTSRAAYAARPRVAA